MVVRSGCDLCPDRSRSIRCATRSRRCSRRPACIRRSLNRFSDTRTSRRRSPSTPTSTWATCAKHFRGRLLPICCQRPQTQKSRPLTALQIQSEIRGLQWSGRLDLNQRPLAPQPAQEAAQPSSALYNPSESFAAASVPAVQGSQGSTTFSRNFATNLLPPIEQLLSVCQVAKLLGVCTATVYRWAADCVLPHVRIVNVVRVRPEDLTTFVAERLARSVARER